MFDINNYIGVNMTMSLNYSEHLHYHPLSSQIFTGMHTVHIDLCRETAPSAWHGHTIRFFLHTALMAGYAVNTVLAFSEGFLFTAFGLVASIPHLALKSRSATLQKYTICSFGHGLNAFAIGWLQITTLAYYINKQNFVQYHSIVTIVNEMTYMLSACISEQLFGALFNARAARAGIIRNEDVGERGGRVLLGALPHSLMRLLSSFILDFGFFVQRIRIGSFSQFFDAFPQHRDLVTNFSFQQIRDPVIRPRLIQALRDFSNHLGFTLPAAQGAANPLEVRLNNNGVNDIAYQNQLKVIIKESFIEIYKSDQYPAYLNQKTNKVEAVQDGKSDMDCFSANIYQPIAHYAQLKEIEKTDIQCPEAFTNRELHQYNARRQKLLKLQQDLRTITADEKNVLIEKLMRMSSFNLSEKITAPDSQAKVQTLFVGISELAGPLHQGKLMSELVLNFDNLAATGRNLFQGACQDAYTELNTTTPTPPTNLT